jgi:hypothetical protein
VDINQYLFLLLFMGPPAVLAVAVVILAYRQRTLFLILASIGFVVFAAGTVAGAIQSATIMVEVNATDDFDAVVPPFPDLGSFMRWLGLGGWWLGVVSLLCHALTNTTRRAT